MKNEKEQTKKIKYNIYCTFSNEKANVHETIELMFKDYLEINKKKIVEKE